jgi:hypothetical protein
MFNQGRININAKRVAIYICVLLITLSILAIILENTVYNNSSANLIRVACIGDSITELPDYPHDLQTLLGSNYTVGNLEPTMPAQTITNQLTILFQTT